MRSLWVRWSWRDLRARWLQVAAIAVIIALGTGVYAGLSSQNKWRSSSYDASYEALAVHDFVVRTASGTTVGEGDLLDVISRLDASDVQVAEERLVVTTQVDASAEAGETVLVPGRIVGVDVAPSDAPAAADGEAGPHVDRLEVVTGRGLDQGDDGEPVIILDSHFAEHFDLPATGEVELSSGPVDYVGTGYSPEYFLVASESGSFLAEAGFAVMFAPLHTAQRLGDRPGEVNELVIRLNDGVDPEEFAGQLEVTLAESLPDAATEIEWIENDRQYRRLYDDVEGDQRLFNIFAGLILAGAGFAAFNLTGRIVEAQRREIGIGMSLGVTGARLAVRPLLVAFQISLLGVVLGIGVGLSVGAVLADLNLQFVPLPVWRDAFQFGVFARGAALGLVLTFAATVWPVVRAVRVDPVDALSTRPRASVTGRRPTARHRHRPGRSLSRFPVRNIVRAPRRTALTALGIAAVITVLIAVVGMVDSFISTVDRGTEEILGASPDRVEVELDSFTLVDDPNVVALGEVEGVASVEPGVRLGGWLEGQDEIDDIEVLISLVDLESAAWQPTLSDGAIDREATGVVLSQKAADDLGVGPGDPVTLRHPRRNGLGYEFVDAEVVVEAIHGNPYRFVLYMDTDDAELFGLSGIVNRATVVPESGVTTDDLSRRLFGQPGVAAVEPVRDVADNVRAAIEELLGFLRVVQFAVLLLAVLIAFNSTSISADERRREHATMFAFGVPVRTVLGLSVAETAIVGALGTVLGVVTGRLLLHWLVRVLLPQTVPDIALAVDVEVSTYATAVVLGVLAVGLAPLLTIRRLRRMDVPATLRVIE